MYLFVYGGCLIPFQSFSKFKIIAEKKKEAKAKAAKDGASAPGRGQGNGKALYLSVKYYNNQDDLALAGDRAVGNVLEQALLFLPLFWMHALFVDPTQSLTIAAIYSVSRLIYPIVYMAALTGNPGMIGISTGPGYLIVMYLFYQVASMFCLA